MYRRRQIDDGGIHDAIDIPPVYDCVMVIVGTGPDLFAWVGGPVVGVSSDSLSSPIPKSSSRSSQTSASRSALCVFALDDNEDFAEELVGWVLKRGRSCTPDGPASSSE